MFRMLKRESLAEHHLMTAQIILCIFPNASRNLLIAAMTHDVGEAVTGDIPSPTKDLLGIRKELDQIEAAHNPQWSVLEQLTPEEQKQLKFADIAARVVFLASEETYGNNSLEVKTMKRNSIKELRRINKEKAEYFEYWPYI